MPPYLRVASELRDKIEHGELRPGDQVPSIVKLGEQYGISRGTARRVLVQLRDWGLIEITPGWGSFVKAAGALMLLVAVLAGCGSAMAVQAPAAPSSCAYQAASLGGQITAQASDVDCGQLLESLASAGETWTPAADPAAPDEWGTQAQVACSLTDGPATLVVRIAGGDQLDAETICSSFEQSGWQPS